MTWDTQHCLPSGFFFFYCPLPVPYLLVTWAGVEVELMELAEFVQQLPQNGKGEGKALTYGKNNENQGVPTGES